MGRKSVCFYFRQCLFIFPSIFQSRVQRHKKKIPKALFGEELMSIIQAPKHTQLHVNFFFTMAGINGYTHMTVKTLLILCIFCSCVMMSKYLRKTVLFLFQYLHLAYVYTYVLRCCFWILCYRSKCNACLRTCMNFSIENNVAAFRCKQKALVNAFFTAV